MRMLLPVAMPTSGLRWPGLRAANALATHQLLVNIQAVGCSQPTALQCVFVYTWRAGCFTMGCEMHRDAVMCFITMTGHFSTAQLARGSVATYNEWPHGHSRVPPCSVKARFGLMCSALAGVRCNLCCLRVASRCRHQSIPLPVLLVKLPRLCCNAQSPCQPCW